MGLTLVWRKASAECDYQCEQPSPAGFDALPVLDLHNPNFTVEGNRLLAELRAKGSLFRVESLGSLGFLRWADCDAILRDFRTVSAAFEHSKPVPCAEEETRIDTLLREDPPKHTRVRAIIQQAFTPERAAAMERRAARGNNATFLHGVRQARERLATVSADIAASRLRWASDIALGLHPNIY